MKEKLRFLGLDVHAETIAVAVAEPDGEVRSLGTIPNRAELWAKPSVGMHWKSEFLVSSFRNATDSVTDIPGHEDFFG